MGFATIGQLRNADVFALQREFGRKIGTYIYNASKGEDVSPVTEKEPSVQYSKISTLSKDSTDEDYLLSNLSRMCEQIHEIVMKNGKLFRSVGIQFVQNDMTGKSRSRMLLHPTASLQDLSKSTKLTCSVGITPNKLISKIASDFKKPDGLTVVRPENVSTFLEPLKIRDLPGIGKKTEVKLESMGFATIFQLRNADVFALQKRIWTKNRDIYLQCIKR